MCQFQDTQAMLEFLEGKAPQRRISYLHNMNITVGNFNNGQLGNKIAYHFLFLW